ncbi:helix-turn-helix domain-containing protein [Patescibacteria group bacterium]|nr:helix-turn-helix domain-containing protein [Patescibacteria group bacterium]MBU0846401.1 helix-turn-helix domain-containing protein [Patescibacteria group bacterium]
MPKFVVDTDELYELNEAATALGIGIATLFRWLKKGTIIPYRVSGRTFILKSEVERLTKKAED